MSKPDRGHSTLSGLIDSDSDDEFMDRDVMPTPDSASENLSRGKKAGKTKITKTKPAPRRVSGRLTAKTKGTGQQKAVRRILADKTNKMVSDTEDLEAGKEEDTSMDAAASGDELDVSFDTAEVQPPVTKITNARVGKNKATSKPSTSKSKGPNKDMIGPSTGKQGSRIRPELPGASPEKAVLETHDPESDPYEYGLEQAEAPASKFPQRIRRSRPASQSRQASVQNRRAGSTSDTDRTDPTMRRKLGEMTNKFESVNLKYQDLREVGLKEADRNFERLKKQSEEKTTGECQVLA